MMINDPRLKIKYISSAFVLISTIAFVHLFIRPISLDIESLFNTSIAAIIIAAIEILIFSHDALYSGDNKFSKVFREHFPSEHIADKFNINTKIATYLWLNKVFNKWENKENKHHQQWKRTLSRGYMCRFVYIIRKTCCYFVIGSIILMSLDIIIYKIFSYELPAHNIKIEDKIIFIIFASIFWSIVGMTNSIKKKNGVFERFNEINILHKSWIDDHIHTIRDFDTWDQQDAETDKP